MQTVKDFFKNPTHFYILAYALGMVLMLAFHWFVGENITMIITFTVTVVLWLSTHLEASQSLLKFQQRIIRGACNLRILTNTKDGNMMPGNIIDIASVGVTALVYWSFGWSIFPAIFLLGQTLFIILLIERKVAEANRMQILSANLNA